MHDNAIHDVALAGWSEWRSPIKRTAVKTNQADGESCLRLVPELLVTVCDAILALTAIVVLRDCGQRALEIRTPAFIECRQVNFLKVEAADPPLRCNGLFGNVASSRP